ncbi:MAG: LLM class F420-dependent oxidoreductase [Actinomycetota bacterium]|nr:LLM class F420-dependent oxidoreductase [Actinomycetota bacterium]
MKLGLQMGYWSAGPPAGAEELILEAEKLGFDSAFTAEAYGSDALTPLAWYGAKTTRIRLGTAIMQLSARTPTAAAMAAISMDYLSGGRFVMGIGASGPQVVEGWYGQPYPKPLKRTREYVDVVRKVIEREGPVSYSGEFYQLPYPGGLGLGKALKSTVHPLRRDIPICLAAEGPKNVALAAEIADGWFPFWFSPKNDEFYRKALQEGFSKRTDGRDPAAFEVICSVPVVINDDIEKAADAIRPMMALYIGGMGAKNMNFHAEVFVRMGYERECDLIQEAFLSGRKEEAMALIPMAMIEDVALIGPLAKVRDELDRWRETSITTLVTGGSVASIRQIAELVLG